MDENNLTTTEEVTTDVTETEVADTQSEESTEVAESVGAEDQAKVEEEQPKQEIDVNAIAAAARRKAEAEVKARDAEYERRFGHLTNPKTGQPIRSEADYFAALDAQEELKAKAELQQKGIDPNLLDNFIANNPTIRQAQAVIAQSQQQQAMAQINADLAELNKIDPSITSIATIPNMDKINEIVQRTGGAVNLVDAYKIVNFGRVSDSKEAAIQQSAINQAKGKQHLSPVNGVATPEEGVEIPSDVLATWKEAFPDKSNAELKKLYNQTL